MTSSSGMPLCANTSLNDLIKIWDVDLGSCITSVNLEK